MNDQVFEPGIPLSITPKESSIPAITGGIFFLTRGGHPPYRYSVKTGGGTIDSEAGYYEAPNQSGKVTIVVTDKKGSSAEAIIEVLKDPRKN